MSDGKRTQKLMLKYPTIDDLSIKAKKRIPHVAWEYLTTGTGSEVLLNKNTSGLSDISLTPRFCLGEITPDTCTNLFGQSFDFPFGIAPVGLTGLMWPRAEIILAKTAKKYNIPFSLSTVATETPETVAPHMGQMGWFQLYPPREKELRIEFMKRARNNGFHTLIITADVPTPSRRERTKRAGLSMPPKITPNFIWQGIKNPVWSFNTLKNGLPQLRTIQSYSEFDTMMSVGAFTRDRLGGNLSWDKCKEIRDYWDGPVILKGLLHPQDALEAVKIGMDGIVVSNHGARQFDGAPSSIAALPKIVDAVQGKISILFDSGVRSGLDVMKALHLGADFVLLGRAFLYGVAALGKKGGDHVVEILGEELKNNMVQFGVKSVNEIKNNN